MNFEHLDLLDAPGLFPAKLNNQLAARLAICDDIGDAFTMSSSYPVDLFKQLDATASDFFYQRIPLQSRYELELYTNHRRRSSTCFWLSIAIMRC